jgi:hypothetical protein
MRDEPLKFGFKLTPDVPRVCGMNSVLNVVSMRTSHVPRDAGMNRYEIFA